MFPLAMDILHVRSVDGVGRQESILLCCEPFRSVCRWIEWWRVHSSFWWATFRQDFIRNVEECPKGDKAAENGDDERGGWFVFLCFVIMYLAIDDTGIIGIVIRRHQIKIGRVLRDRGCFRGPPHDCVMEVGINYLSTADLARVMVTSFAPLIFIGEGK